MRNFSKLLAIVLSLALLVCMLAACASNEKNAAPTPSESNAPANSTNANETPDTPSAPDASTPETGAPETSEQAPSEAPAPSEPDEEPEELVEINMYILDMLGNDAEATKAVEQAINDYIEDKINVHVNMSYLSVGEYGQTLNLAISGNEQVDICCVWLVPPATFTGMYAAGQLMDIQPYMDQYGADLQATVGEYLNAYRVNGGLYGVPCFRNYAASVYLMMREDILDELGMKDFFENEVDTMTELETVFASIRDNYHDLYATRNMWNMTSGLNWYGDSLDEYNVYDTLGDTMFMLSVDVNSDTPEIQCTWELEDTVFNLKKEAEWYQAGYIWPDTVVTDMSVYEVLKQGIVASSTQPSEIGVEASVKGSTGFDCICKNVGNAAISTSVVTRFGLGVPVTAREPEAAVKFLNLLYTDSTLMDLMDYGIQGVHWDFNDAGEASYVDGMSYRLQDFILGNFFLAQPWVGTGADFRARAMDALHAAPVSPYLGFVLDTTELNDLVASISTVSVEYQSALQGYGYDERSYQEYLRRLETAGLRDYIGAAQAQLDAWVASR